MGIVTIEIDEEVDGKTVKKPKKYKKRKKMKKKNTDRDSYEMVLCTPPQPEEDTIAWTCAKRVFSAGKFVTVCVATYLLFFQGWFAVNAACDRTVGSIERSEKEKEWYKWNKDKGWVENLGRSVLSYHPTLIALDKAKDAARYVTGKSGDKMYADYFGTPAEKVCSYYNYYGGMEMGRFAFNPALQKIHGGTFEKHKEFQDAWNNSYAGQSMNAGDAEYPRQNINSQFFTSALSFLSGYALLKWAYPAYAAKLVAGIIYVGVIMAKWEDERFGMVTWIGGCGASLAAMYCGLPPSVVGGLKTAGGAMKNFGAQKGGFNVQNPLMTGPMHPQRGMLMQPQMQPQMRMVKKKKSKDSNSASGCSSD